MFSKILKKKESLQIALSKVSSREYDLPLKKSEDSKFLVLLVCLMSFLAILSFTGTFALNGMTSRWSSGMEDKITLEIPIETDKGHLLSRDTVEKEARHLGEKLSNHPNVKSLDILDERDISELISPWLGKDMNLQDIPLPALISVELKVLTAESLQSFEEDVDALSDFAIVQTHQDWLNDLIRFAKTLKILALAIAVIVGTATVTAIAAGIRTRFAIHKKEVELLHLMGASDDYISRQFQRHAMMIALQGSLLGTVGGIAVSLTVIILSGFSGTSLIPRIEISVPQFLMLCLVPVMACIIAGVTSRLTVLRTLAKMP